MHSHVGLSRPVYARAMREAVRVLVVVAGVVVAVAVVGCKKHEAPATAGSASGSAAGSAAGSASGSASNGSGSGAIGSNHGSNAGSNANAPTTGDKLGSDVLDKETIGGVALGDEAGKITTALGKPTKKGKVTTDEGVGATVQSWDYGSSLLTVANVDGKWIAFSIQVAAPTDWKTSKGIHIGSTKAEVEAVYDGEERDDGFLVGTVYGGELFTMKDGKVTEIFLGAMAE